MKLYLIRHGESEANAKRVHAGWQAVHLTERGIEQAKRIGEYLNGLTFDKIYSSDLVRAMETAEAALPKREYVTDERLREVNVGTVVGKGREECTAEYGEPYINARKYRDYTAFGGECENDLISRAKSFITDPVLRECECVAVFTHEGFIRATLEAVIGTEIKEGTVAFPNCIISVFEIDDEGHAKLYAWNVTG